ncbi:alpha/beta fold hydrolase [Rhodococcoides yunnanense]|uniref:Alpha/beta fold hydrolase n=1 Tax=Rhodococcoides yunnanense TaxID=278209 RepID=A0ABU4B6K7_9NOCA|nr:alpha/beta fold hydrolase [Rhodococcus yunnanensis]MDV6259781.1 alpha/beta fold hydrolase [Rhodococcus yunnanensis]
MTSEAIVLLHGLGASAAAWDRVVPLLPGNVLALDLAGSETIEHDALAVAREIRVAGFESVTVVGHSRGGLVATSLAEQYPALVRRLVLVATTPTISSRLTARGLSEKILRTPLLGDAVWAMLPAKKLRKGLGSAFAPGGPVPEFAVQDLVNTGIRRFRTSTSSIDHYLEERSLSERLAALGCSISVVYGLDDRRVDSAQMALSASSPTIDAYPLPYEGHGAPWSSAGAIAAVINEQVAPSEARRPLPAHSPSLRPVRWTPPRSTDRAREKESVVPMGPIRRVELPGRGPEDVRLDSQGRILTGLHDGRVLRVTLVDETTSTVETLADTGGRPLGIAVVDDSTVLVCDSERGVLRVDLDSGGVEVVLDRLDNVPITFASNIVQAATGNIYFTVSTRRFGFDDFLADLLEHSGTGHLVKLMPDGTARIVVDGIQFANGLTVSDNEEFATVVSSGNFDITRYSLVDSASQPQILIDNLPAFPDNVSVDGDLTWVSMATPRNALHDFVARLPGIIRRVAYSLPEEIRQGEQTTWVIAVDGDGSVVHDLQSPTPDYSMVTSVVRRGAQLILGSISESALAVVDLPEDAS